MALMPLEEEDQKNWADEIALICHHCEVTWRGIPMEPCWLCGLIGIQPAGTTLVRD